MKSISAFHILVITPLQSLPSDPRDAGTAEIIHVKKRRRKKVWSSSSEYVSNFAVIKKRKSIGEYGGVLADTEVQGTSNCLYEFDFLSTEWIDCTDMLNIGGNFSIQSGKKDALQGFKSWLTQTYENAQIVSKIGGLNESEEHLTPRIDLYESCNTVEKQVSKEPIQSFLTELSKIFSKKIPKFDERNRASEPYVCNFVF